MLPRRLVVLGGGPIGCELGQAFARLGAQVTIVEALPHLLAARAARTSANTSARVLEAEGVAVHLATTATRVDPAADGDGFVLTTDGTGDAARDGVRPHPRIGRTATVDVRPRPRVGRRRARRTRLRHRRRPPPHLGARGIYAAGDVTGMMPFTHVAAYQARSWSPTRCSAMRRNVSYYDDIPSVTFTDPEIARVGLDAGSGSRALGRQGARAALRLRQPRPCDRPRRRQRLRRSSIGDPKGRLVGATVVGTAAGESIAELTAWIATGAKIATISQTVHAYPTFSEGPSRAADDVLRAKYFSPKMRRVTRPVLSLLRLFDRARARGR